MHCIVQYNTHRVYVHIHTEYTLHTMNWLDGWLEKRKVQYKRSATTNQLINRNKFKLVGGRSSSSIGLDLSIGSWEGAGFREGVGC